ncbi:NADPH:quinone reductase [archaeon CG10_big_fil_rev_8_21_14_0_10_43_11]|nr:MAG: NADPH:quinone reductase [archaeon CG10_big_fil_rev_8_21_14_0_10_43_11]
MKKVLIIIGHPQHESFSHTLARAYKKGAQSAHASVRIIDVRTLEFDPVLWEGYGGTQVFEHDLEAAQAHITWADHIVFVYPTWWGGLPALLKGFVERVFLPGFAFKYEKGSGHKELLARKSARIITTAYEAVNWVEKMRANGHKVFKYDVLEFCGMKPVHMSYIAPEGKPESDMRAYWQKHVERLGAKLA